MRNIQCRRHLFFRTPCQSFVPLRLVQNFHPNHGGTTIATPPRKTNNQPTDLRKQTRVWYNRYGHDFLVGICAPKETVIKIKEEIKQFLSTELDLLLNEDQTSPGSTDIKTIPCISQKAFYLGFEIGLSYRRDTQSRTDPHINGTSARGAVAVSGTAPAIPISTRRHDATRVQIYAPIDKLVEKLIHHKFALRKDKPCALTKWIYLEPHQILFRYLSLLHSLLHYYNMVVNLNLFTHIV